MDWSLFYFPLMALIALSMFIAYLTWKRLLEATTLGLKVQTRGYGAVL